MDDEIDSKFILFSPWTFIFFLLILILGNLFIIDAALFLKKTPTSQNQLASIKPQASKITPTPTSPTCVAECRAEIQKAADAIILKPQTASSNPAAKEFFVPLGSGSSTALEWTEIPGAQSYIDSNSYGKIKNVTLEVSIHTPTGNQEAEARLYNVTDQHPVWNSDVKVTGGTPQLKISSPIILDKGSKLYVVQMRTQLQARTNLENARIHIMTY